VLGCKKGPLIGKPTLCKAVREHKIQIEDLDHAIEPFGDSQLIEDGACIECMLVTARLGNVDFAEYRRLRLKVKENTGVYVEIIIPEYTDEGKMGYMEKCRMVYEYECLAVGRKPE
jgi:hypothetical protein